MTNEVAGNYLRVHRRKVGLSQRELGILVGYAHGHAVGRHERSRSAPPLLVAMAYELVFDTPVAQLFSGFRLVVTESVARNMQELKTILEREGGGKDRSNLEKRQWILQRLG